MKSKKRVMRKFRKKRIVFPILGFVFGVIFMLILITVVTSAEVSGVYRQKVETAKAICNIKATSLIESLPEYGYDMNKAIENNDNEIIILKDIQKLYGNSDADVVENVARIVDGDDEHELAITYSSDDLKEIADKNNGMVIPTDGNEVELSIPQIIDYCYARGQENMKGTFFESNAWITTDVEYEGGKVLIHYPISLSFEDIAISVIVVGVMALIFVVVLAILISNIIASAVNSNRMLAALYFDDKTLTNNWLFLTTKGEKLIRNRNGIYAVISIKSCKYDHCKSCSGVDSADKLILNIFNRLRTNLNKNDLIARNSEGYIGIIVRRNTVEEIQRLVESFIKNSAEPVCAGVYLLTPDKRVADASDSNEGIEDYYHYAKLACDSLNDGSETAISYFDDKLKEENIWINRVESRLDEALANEEFVVYIQPKYDPKDSTLKGAEALIRWVSPEDGLISPGRFIPICEENGTIVKIDDYMIAHIAKLQSDWISKGYKVVPVSVNVSRVHFMDPNLAEHIGEIVDRYNTPHDTIEIELTESAFFDDKKVLLQTVEKLQNLGFQVSMDDFGSGYSSLNSLKDLALDVLKLDADFFRGEGKESRGELIVGKAIEMAKALNMEIVAEGVEQKEQVDFLADAGCDMIQGYYFAKPMPADEYESRMSKEE